MIDIQLSEAPLSVEHCIQKVCHSPQSGGVNVFIGTVRGNTKGKAVLRLEFEAYEPMAIQEMHRIAQESCSRWPLHQVVIHHRTGVLKVGEIPVVIAVAAAHRAAAFEACRFLIDTLKERVPIWKKEVFEDGEVWVAAHP
jgi:molybdopterin synthase catalytic subunit